MRAPDSPELDGTNLEILLKPPFFGLQLLQLNCAPKALELNPSLPFNMSYVSSRPDLVVSWPEQPSTPFDQRQESILGSDLPFRLVPSTHIHPT